MTVREAYRILGLAPGAGEKEIKKRYRQLMMEIHPDAGKFREGESTGAAQEINGAYSVLKKRFGNRTGEGEAGAGGGRAGGRKDRPPWDAPVNEHAYRAREILHYAEDREGNILGSFSVARGKFLWKTEEDFSLFLLSIYRCGKELLDELDAFRKVRREPAFRQQIQAELTYLLAQQFMDGLGLLRELARMERKAERDSEKGNDGEAGNDRGKDPEVFYLAAMAELGAGVKPVPPGAALYPARLKGHRLYLKDGEGREMGYLSFPDDRLYYVVIPLFEQRRVQVKIRAAEKKPSGSGRAKKAYQHLHLWIRIPEGEVCRPPESLNLQIENLLQRYRG